MSTLAQHHPTGDAEAEQVILGSNPPKRKLRHQFPAPSGTLSLTKQTLYLIFVCPRI